MHITEVVLDGFKSFGRTTRIPFYEDFTVVTGPNGSGKSNIIDGVLFALGLARTRGIRAKKLTDLIYNPGHDDGEAADGPNEASVTVVLSNEDGTLDRSQVVSAAGTENVGDVSEITIKRRVKETEDNYYSYYYLNGRSVNLSDVQDLLASAGVTPEGYNVVMQGDVTEIINMTPYQRRGIVDEIAGVAEFDEKKEAAYEELDTVEDRIGEADLRIGEKQDRLDQLADERETALQYQELREELEEYRGFRKASELEEKREALADVEGDIDAAETDLAELREELDARQGKLTRLEEDLADLNHEIETKGEEEQIEIRSEIEEIKGEVSRLEDRIESAESRAESAENDRRQAFVQIDRKEEKIEELDAEIRETKVEKASVKSELATKRSELADVEAEIEGADTEFDELKAELAEKKEAIESLREEKNETQREKDRLLDEARRRSNAVSEAREELEDARESIPEHKARISELKGELDKAEKNEATIEDAVADLFAEKAEKEERLGEIEDTLREKQNEYAKLEAAADERGDASWPRAVTEVKNGGIDGVHGAVGELGSVAAEYAEACETAAGGRLANVVVDDDGVGSTCIDYLKRRNAGRATFLPITKMDDRSLPRKPSVPGVVDFARNLVDYDAEYESIFSYVLGSTLVVEDMATARDLMGDYRMVTLDGDLVEKSGAMTGGSGGGSRYSFTKSGGGKLERLATEISELEDERQSVQSEIDALDDDIADARDRKADAAERVRSLEADVERAEDDLAEAEARIAELEDELEELEAERESVDEQMTALDEELAETDAAIDELEAEISEIEAELADSKIPELSERADEIRAEIDELEDRMDSLDGRINELELEKGYAEDALDGLHDDVEEAQNAKAEAEEAIADHEAAIEEKEAELAEKKEAIADLEAELTELKEEREELREEIREATRKRDEQRSLVSEAESDLSDLTDRRDRLEWEIDELESQVGDYDADEIPDLDEVESRIEAIEAEMEALEPVNMLAIDEYDEVQAALDELQERRDVLVEERDAIEERIEGYEAAKKETFMQTFESINDHFRDIFARLSAGTGELVLENPEDPFEEGLTMKAQPADKPVQRLDAMSGGEKSLTALSFIFAVQRHNPAPFYALDEIDAFLDAVNAERVGEMIEELAEDAQFVVVGHRSALLERSDRAIGVTMQGDNLSAVTGMQFGDDADEEEVSADD
ncbi:chromosome segregation protein SMC [Halorubrum sp. Atlit-8R]|uniref:chromosome segregation protein SMC n=1 Tax=unclassified Halorubrum TaxID=2642239 RepID=UPI000EF177A5|nr:MULTISPECIES: chromosome segregation protein SMC [unclassified Halorubrum]RLM71429.1 chromosome segregation protein SMC [Halorubrum sp. Atlit-9R]RLM82418.1 chromosome segregation protein SMC [Halorubrum sp. Atlit-8R]